MAALTTRANIALPDPYVHEAPRTITEEEREFKAYRTLREQRAIARHEGKRKQREAKVRDLLLLFVSQVIDQIPCNLQKAEEEANKKK